MCAAEFAAEADDKPPLVELDAPAQLLLGMGRSVSAV